MKGEVSMEPLNFAFLGSGLLLLAIGAQTAYPSEIKTTESTPRLLTENHLAASPLGEQRLPTAVGTKCKAVVDGLTRCNQGVLTYEPADETVRITSQNQVLPCSDKRHLPFYSRAENMDVISTLFRAYPSGKIPLPEQRPYQDPGRLRNPVLLGAIYGNSKASVKANLVDVPFLGKTVKFNDKNGAAESLARVGRRLDLIAKTEPEIESFLDPFRGEKSNLPNDTFNWRPIAGSQNLSPHSYGIAIDLETGKEKANYWLWEEQKRLKNIARAKRDRELREDSSNAEKINDEFNSYKKSIDNLREKDVGPIKPKAIHQVPWQVVKAFEEEGFIWGGKWNHFDCMHFEYRPEFFPNLKKRCAPMREPETLAGG
jgi:hypothetical protein